MTTALAAAASPGQTRESVASDIVEVDRRLNRFIVTHDVQQAGMLYDDDFVLTVSGGRQKTKHDMLADIGNPALSLEVCETTDAVVRVRDGTAVLTGLLLQAGQIDGRRFSVKLRVTDTWVRTTDGRWQLLAGHASPEKPPA